MKNTWFHPVILLAKVVILCVFFGAMYVALYKWLVPEVPVPYEYVNPNQPQLVKRGVVFAAYNKNWRIPDYVVRYLQELKKTESDIVFISDNPVLPSEVKKIKNLVLYARFEKHGEYDFGSYKRGLNYLLDHHLLKDNSELILCNDSAYGPFFPLSDIFHKMNQRNIDFWGMSFNKKFQYHLQSYFLYFRNSKLIQNDLRDFLNKVHREEKKDNVIQNYEVALTEYLNQKGYREDSFIPKDVPFADMDDIILSLPIQLIDKYRFPFLKRYIFTHPGWLVLSPDCFSYIHEKFPDFYGLIISDLKESQKKTCNLK